MQLFIITYDNAHWCSGQLNCVVTAESAEQAELLAECHMTECQRELFSSEYDDLEPDDEELEELEECPYNVISVEVLDHNNEYWESYNNPDQSSFYPVVN